MKVTQPGPITELISATKRTFDIPVYQRNYVWKVEDCERLFEDVIEGIKHGTDHYFGNIVYYVESIDPITGYVRYILIDGQQRITSTMLLLAAVRDEEENDEIRENISKTYLKNENSADTLRIKLKQVETDRIVYELIIDGRTEHVDTSSVIYRNYRKFRSLVKKAKLDNELTSSDLIQGIRHLNIIGIDLESNSIGAESPQVIFESINATGEPLSTADLLRNFLLLEVGVDKQADIYQNYWLIIERNIGNENISDFIRRYLTLKSTEDIKKDTEYKAFKKSYKDYFTDAEEAIKELTHFSKYYRWIKNPESISREKPKTAKTLQDLDDLRMLPATPAIMWLLEKADNGEITFEDVNDTLDVIASWSFRARITNIISTGEIGTILTTKILELFKNKQSDEAYADYLWFELSNYRSRDIYPSDEVFMEAFSHYDFYKSYRKYVQEKLSLATSNDQTDVVLESIEHIMPQSIRQDKWPNISVSDHAEWVNTIGNLAPLNMKDNLDNSNNSFESKIENIKNSDWQITRNIDTDAGWGIETILARGEELAKIAATIWRTPQARKREIEVSKLGTKANRGQKFIEWIDELGLPNVKVDKERSRNVYIFFTTDFLDQLIPRRDEPTGGWRNGVAAYYELKTDSSGWTRINASFNSEDANKTQLNGQRIVMDALNKYPGKDNWKWFNPIGWTLDYEGGDNILKDEVRRVLEEEIPRFEHEIFEAQKV
jgi:uncharacterized protein with ParB-like and HNH nuclease domain